jgi:hypothetical protein
MDVADERSDEDAFARRFSSPFRLVAIATIDQ